MNQEYLKGIHSEMCGKDAIIFRATENNIISFLKNSLSAERSEIRTLDGKRFLTTIKGKWIDICPDRMYLEEKLKPLLLAVKEGKKKSDTIKTNRCRTVRRILSANARLELFFLVRL